MKINLETLNMLIEDMNISLSASDAELLMKNTELIRVPKNAFIVNEGDKLRGICLIVKGLARGYYIDVHGNEITRCFSAEGDFVCSEGMFKDAVATFHIQAIEDTEGIVIYYDALKKLIQNNRSIAEKYDEYSKKAILIFDERQHSLLTKTATERYNDFMKDYCNIEKRINQEYIASYIGIRASSLSRLKRNMKN